MTHWARSWSLQACFRSLQPSASLIQVSGLRSLLAFVCLIQAFAAFCRFTPGLCDRSLQAFSRRSSKVSPTPGLRWFVQVSVCQLHVSACICRPKPGFCMPYQYGALQVSEGICKPFLGICRFMQTYSRGLQASAGQFLVSSGLLKVSEGHLEVKL